MATLMERMAVVEAQVASLTAAVGLSRPFVRRCPVHHQDRLERCGRQDGHEGPHFYAPCCSPCVDDDPPLWMPAKVLQK